MAERKQHSEDLNFEKVWLMFQETDRKFQETDKKLNKLENLFTGRWGKLIESLVAGDLIKLLQDRGIKVNFFMPRVKLYANDREYEFDIIAENSTEVVFVEVKTTLRVEDVKEFLAEMKGIRELFPKYINYKIYAAMAYLLVEENSDRLASRYGFFTIRATGNSASITNSKKFIPKIF